MNKTMTARSLAVDIIGEILEGQAYSNVALRRKLNQSSLSEKDRSLVTELVYGTIARKITLEWYVAHYIEDRDQLDAGIYHLLLVSFYQLLYLTRIPERAVVYEAVDLAKVHPGADRLVNAVLRRFLSEERPDPEKIKRKNKRLSVLYSIPVWLVKELIEEYGEDRAIAIAKSLEVRNKASVRVVHPERLASLAQELGMVPSLLSPVGLVKAHGHLAASRAFREGDITIQDETSQLVAPTLQLEGNEEVLDACAAPGGKTMHIASYLETGHVTALDIYDHKLALIEENAQRLGVTDRVRTKRLDARQVAAEFGPDRFDKILVDAPCSGIGLIRRKPDIKYRKEAFDFEQLQEIQLEILASVCQTVKKGGIITYSTCTILRKENQEVLRAFLDTHPNFEQVHLEHPQREIMVDGCLLITPELFETDGFFISQLRRTF